MTQSPAPRPPMTLLIAAPRGFCAGVDRAIRIVELALEKHGAPVYVRHEIVHNKFVVDSLKAKGAIFVEELDQVPDGVPVVFSSHGVPKAVPAKAEERGLEEEQDEYEAEELRQENVVEGFSTVGPGQLKGNKGKGEKGKASASSDI